MKTYRTVIEPKESINKINFQTPVLFMGSCFTENIGLKMQNLKFPALVNPFGVLYNPVSVRQSIEILLDSRDFKETDLGYYDELWYSFYHDTEFSHPDKEVCLNNINLNLSKAREHFKNVKYLIVTFGTAWVYEHTGLSKIVSNCHKIPAKEFKRYKLGVEDIFVNWAKLINRIEDYNPDLKIIFTVSPVRHWKDGAVQNQLSKSTLILAIHQLKKIFEQVEYFPSYEIMMDDLRDYRFYANDMLHPSNIAIDYIWENYTDTYFDKLTKEIIKEIEKILQAKEHRTFNPNTNKHKSFIKNNIEKINQLQKKYPFIDFKEDLDFFTKK